MKSLVQTKNKFLHSLGDNKSAEDTQYNSLKKYYEDLLSQQRKVYKNLVKQQPALKQISLNSFCEQLKKNGCESNPHMQIYSSCVKNVDRIISEHEGKTQEHLSTISNYLREAKGLKIKCKDRDNSLVEYDLAQNDLLKLQSKADTPTAKLYPAQQKADSKKSVFEASNSLVCSDLNNIISNKTSLFDVHVQKVIQAQKTLYESIRAQFSDLQDLRASTTPYSSSSYSSVSNSISSATFAPSMQPNRSSQSYTLPSSTPSTYSAPSYYPTPSQPSPPQPQPIQSEPQHQNQTQQAPNQFQQVPPQNQFTQVQSQNQFTQVQPQIQHQNQSQIHTPTQPLPFSRPLPPQKPRSLPSQPNDSYSQSNLQRNTLSSAKVGARSSVTLPPSSSSPVVSTPSRPPSVTLKKSPPLSSTTSTESNTNNSPPHVISTPSRPPSVILKKPPPSSIPSSDSPPSVPTPARAPRASVTLPQPSPSPNPSPRSSVTLPPTPLSATPSPNPSPRSSVTLPPTPLSATPSPNPSPRSSITLPQPPSVSPRSSTTLPQPPLVSSRSSTTFSQPPPSVVPAPTRSPRASTTFSQAPTSLNSSPSQEEELASVPNPFTLRSRGSTTAPLPASSLSPSSSKNEELEPVPNPFTFRPRAATTNAPPRPLNTTPVFSPPAPAFTQPSQSVIQQLVQMNIGEDRRIGYYDNAISTYFTGDLTKNFPEPKLRAFIEGMTKHGNPLSFETVPASRPTSYAVAITFKLTPEAKYIANVDFFFETEKLSGMFSQKGVEMVPFQTPVSTPSFTPSFTPTPTPSFSPPAQKIVAVVPIVKEDPKVAVWRAIMDSHLQGRLGEALNVHFTPQLLQVFNVSEAQKFIEVCLFFGNPYRYELCKGTKDGYVFGVKMIFKETYLVEHYCTMNLKFDNKNKITQLQSDGAKVQFVPVSK